MTRSAGAHGKGSRMTDRRTLNTAVAPPMPRPSVRTTAMAYPGERASVRKAWRRSRIIGGLGWTATLQYGMLDERGGRMATDRGPIYGSLIFLGILLAALLILQP